MSGGPADLAGAYFDAWLAKDFDTLRSLLADDVGFRGPLASFDGADECVAGLRGMSQIMTDMVVHKRWVDGPDVITWFDLHTTVAPPTATANWSRVEHGRIATIRVAFDARRFAPPRWLTPDARCLDRSAARQRPRGADVTLPRGASSARLPLAHCGRCRSCARVRRNYFRLCPTRTASSVFGAHRVQLDPVDEGVLVDRPCVRGAVAQGLAVGLAGAPDVRLGDRRERDELDGVDLDQTGADSVAAALLDLWPPPQPDRQRYIAGQHVIAQLAAELHTPDASW
jgi:hypothetical protein